ncbi:SanA/YdcF family protein [Candidatus Viridilinea mediisalina]|uniref:DUF218 domain-containing protein n=1 Tax=Candidatus Viridilinea mediisalina TaxID=2024553 RepID=A0A2A6RQ52_9CHLR|nr:ElyC/SanA/YdcF family protein [Candidatus Viridilinea mediisalina]PDW05076.1 hypothetical protein CJ255_00345 [Candidatus Viridilinea mediisalina]
MPITIKNLRRLIALGLGLSLLVPLLALSYSHVATARFRLTNPTETPATRVAVVFGAGIRGDQPTRILAERIEGAAELYHLGRVEKLLMTGDNSRADYDEVTVMARYAERLGVPASAITRDYAGFSTYESCYRLQPIFGVEQAVLISQRYHVPRAVYTCRALGVDAVGFGVPDWGRYAPPLLVRYTLREALATVKALVDVHLTRPRPTFLGPYEGIE